LDFGEEESKVAVDLVVALKDTGGLDTFVGGGDLDEDTGFVNTDGFVELMKLVQVVPWCKHVCVYEEKHTSMM
jgi:hypothetical protein